LATFLGTEPLVGPPHHRIVQIIIPDQLAVLHDEANSLQLAYVGKRISSHGHEIREFAVWSAEIRSVDPAGFGFAGVALSAGAERRKQGGTQCCAHAS